MDLVQREDATLDVKPRMQARERGVVASTREHLKLGLLPELIFCGGRTRGIEASQSAINAMRVRRELGRLADKVAFLLDEQSTNTLENLVEAWKIITKRAAHASVVRITFVTDISHQRASSCQRGCSVHHATNSTVALSVSRPTWPSAFATR
jgi:hypothetical protein